MILENPEIMRSNEILGLGKFGYGNLGWITRIEAYFEQTQC